MRARQAGKSNRVALVVLSVVAGVLALAVCGGVIGGMVLGIGSEPKRSTDPSAAAVAAPADPSKLDEAATFACTDFAKGYKAAQTKDARVELANKVNKWAASSKTNRITDMGAALGRGADGSAAAWTTTADAFAVACTDAGWTADKAQ